MLERQWKFILLQSYTAWAFYALALVTLAPDAIYLVTGRDTDPALWATLQLWIILLGLVGRLVLQPQAGRWRRRITVAVLAVVTVLAALPALAQATERQTMQVLVPLVVKWEGEHRCADDRTRHCAYLDIVGVPTICYGETQGVRLGQRATDAECMAMLERRLVSDFRAGLHRYFSAATRTTRLTPQRDAAYVSLAYNVGIAGAGRSTATRRLNAGDIEGGCEALTWWNRAGGRVVRGLVNRRSEERALCMEGLA